VKRASGKLEAPGDVAEWVPHIEELTLVSADPEIGRYDVDIVDASA